jgi:hypothetical protein
MTDCRGCRQASLKSERRACDASVEGRFKATNRLEARLNMANSSCIYGFVLILIEIVAEDEMLSKPNKFISLTFQAIAKWPELSPPRP